jgi:GAF domain-containing protein
MWAEASPAAVSSLGCEAYALLHLAAIRGGVPGTEQQLHAGFPQPLRTAMFSGATIVDREVKQIADIEAEDRWGELLRTNARVRGWRAALAVPMLLDGQPIGAINVTRVEPGAFSAPEVELLKTFADQAVIAIENARLLSELQQRNEALTQAHAQVAEALEQLVLRQNVVRLSDSLGASETRRQDPEPGWR